MPTRQQMWDRLGEPVDLLIIGGGINGAGAARDAARRGLSVALVEMRDLASGTSSASSKLVHGGLRYLEQFEFGLVFESVSERRVLLAIAPHLVNPLGFLFPIFESSRRALATISAGMWLYEGLSLFRSPKRHVVLSPAEIKAREPALSLDGMKGAPLYYDCSTDDARLTLESCIDAYEHGACVVTRARAVGFFFDERGRAQGATVRDEISGAERRIEAKVIVNASGPWTDRVLGLESSETIRPILRPTKGVHLVLHRDALHIENAVVCLHPEDGRVLFAVPWGEHTYVGTTDTDYDGDPAEVRAERADVDYLLDVVRHYFPNNPVVYDDVISTWAGLRPLIRPEGDGGDESSVSREHKILARRGVVTVAGGKLTTYRKMAREVVDAAVQHAGLRAPSTRGARGTDRAPLPGAVGWPSHDDHDRIAAELDAKFGGLLGPKTALLLINTYGMRAYRVAEIAAADPSAAAPIVEGRPEIVAQIEYAVRHEFAYSVEDVLERRTQIFYRAPDQGRSAAGAVAARIGAALGWDEATIERAAREYRERVRLSRAWRDE